jgi:hypothetical protein
METILLVFLLNIKSSYLLNKEEPSALQVDTVQFLHLKGNAWRIKTFAIDHDVHVWHLGPMNSKDFEETAFANTKRHYADVLASHVKITSRGDLAALEAKVTTTSLGGTLEIAKDKRFVFWVPALGHYKTKSTPQ